MFVELVKVQTEAGNEGRVNEYRRLIAAGVGLAQSEVDNAIPALLEVRLLQFCSVLKTDKLPGARNRGTWLSINLGRWCLR